MSPFDQLTDPDRRATMAAILKGMMGGSNLREFAQFLCDEVYLQERERLEEAKLNRVILDFLSAYPKFVETDEDLARQILHRFIDLLFRRDEELDVTNTFAWLQSGVNVSLLLDAVEHVASEQWHNPADADPRKIQRFRLLCRRSRASLWRRQQRYEEAREELVKLIGEWEDFDPQELKEVAVIHYEIGYLDYLRGEISSSAEALFRGAELAEQAGDPVGQLINSFNAYHSLYQGRRISLDDADQEFRKHLRQLIELARNHPEDARCGSWRRSICQRLFVLACEREDPQAAETFLADANRGGLTSRGDPDPAYVFVRCCNEGRLALARDHHDAALRHWATFLDVELPGLEQFRDENVREIHLARFEQAAFYLLAGRTYLFRGESEIANRLFARGLKLCADKGNTFFHEDIRQLMKEHNLPGPRELDHDD